MAEIVRNEIQREIFPLQSAGSATAIGRKLAITKNELKVLTGKKNTRIGLPSFQQYNYNRFSANVLHLVNVVSIIKWFQLNMSK